MQSTIVRMYKMETESIRMKIVILSYTVNFAHSVLVRRVRKTTHKIRYSIKKIIKKQTQSQQQIKLHYESFLIVCVTPTRSLRLQW